MPETAVERNSHDCGDVIWIGRLVTGTKICHKTMWKADVSVSTFRSYPSLSLAYLQTREQLLEMDAF